MTKLAGEFPANQQLLVVKVLELIFVSKIKNLVCTLNPK
jgi:hypothetical protein